VPERCTCGAKLPEDALFCHKCGKPQREIAFEQPEPEPAPPPIPVVAIAPQPPIISFHNGTAVRIALMMGALGFLCMLLVGQLHLPEPLIFIWLGVAGFLAVYLYQKSTGQKVSVLNGARLGWISGIFVFVIVTLMFIIALTEPTTLAIWRDQIKARGIPDVDQMITVLRSPAGIASAISLFFLLFTVLPAFGGAVGAKLLDRD
jgi:hypothetical protein